MMRPLVSRTGEIVSDTSSTCAVAGDAQRLDRHHPLGPGDLCQELLLQRAQVVGDDQIDVAADRLLRGVAEHRLGAGIPREDAPVERLGDDRVFRALDHCGQQPTHFVRAAPIGDVQYEPAALDQNAVLPTAAGADERVLDGAVAAAKAEGRVVQDFAGAQSRQQVLDDVRVVVELGDVVADVFGELYPSRSSSA